MERLKRAVISATIWGVLLLFSFFLMFHTFGYDTKRGSILIAPKLWSDFGAHIPLIRSFSMGDNWPPESPLYPSEPIRYHFGFYFLVGLLEKLGVRIDWALNVPSTLGFFSLLVLTYFVGRTLFRDRAVGVLSVIFLLFNGSLSFLRFFQSHPLSFTTPYDIVTNSRFPAFGPWDGGDITAFWTLNIYTNQRHLALSYALVLALIVLASRAKLDRALKLLATSVIFAIFLSALMFINYAALATALLFLAWFFIIQPSTRPVLLISALLSFPIFLYVRSLVNLSPAISLYPGYLVDYPLSPFTILRFWFANLGLYCIFIPAGVFLARRDAAKFLAIPLFVLFLVPNIWRFSPDMINNHKFFNFALIIGSMFTAYVLVSLWSVRARILGVFSKGIAVIAFFFLTLSGVIDFFPILNESKGSLADIPANKSAAFFANETPPDAVVLNSYWFYHPASIAGRPIFSGYSYFTWSYGYDQTLREKYQTDIFRSKTLTEACRLLRSNDISFVELSDHPENYVQPNWELWKSLQLTFRDDTSNLTVFDVREICPLQ